MGLLELTDKGLYCPAGDFHIDPWGPVERAVVTHAHADHARWGSRFYLASERGRGVLRIRLGDKAHIETLAYGESRSLDGVEVSLHPAGHILGSAQVRVEHRGEVWVVTGDYKTPVGDDAGDPTTEPFELVPCNTLVTESTFALPVYRWRPQSEVFADVNAWWRSNVEADKTSLLYGYALGKAQRLLAGVDSSIGPILIHGAVQTLMPGYEAAGVQLPAVEYASPENAKKYKGRALVVAPPSAAGSPWVRKFAPASDAFASGWMALRGTRRRRALDRGFVLSDHADWDGVLSTIEACGAETVWATHGYTHILVRYLRERGLDAHAVETRFVGEAADGSGDEEGTP